MAINRDKYQEVHDRAGAESIQDIGRKFIAQVNRHLAEVKQGLNDGSIGTQEDAAECDLANSWYKALVPFISQMELDSSAARQSFFKTGFNDKAKPQYTAEDYNALEIAHDAALHKVYSNVMAKAEQVHEGLIGQAIGKAEQLDRKKTQEEGAPEAGYRQEVTQRFLVRLSDLMIELHDIVMPDMTDEPEDDFSGRKGPSKKPGGPKR